MTFSGTSHARRPAATRLVSTSRELATCRLDRLAPLGQHSQLYWYDPHTRYEFRGIGTAAILQGSTSDRFTLIENRIRQLLTEAVLSSPPLGPRWVGGFAFTHQYLSDRVWQTFDPACFILPHFQLEQIDDRFFVTINVLADYQDDPRAVQQYSEEALSHFIADLTQTSQQVDTAEPLDDTKPTSEGIEIHEPVPKGAWVEAVDHILATIRAGTVRKAVLAQIRELRSSQGFNLYRAFRFLRQTYPECYVFLFRNGTDSAFLGASPELLCAVNGSSLRSMALAGTSPRDPDPVRDQQNRQDLHRSAKNQHEHRIVIDGITTLLEQHGACVAPVPETHILSLHNVHHLCTPLQAVCRVPRSALQWASLLHPTAALGGEPQDRAMSLIEELESVPRGWYGAPFGIVDSNLNGIFTAAIRSGVVHGSRAWLFAGAGIVAGSDPHTEWQETDWKFQSLQQALVT